MPYVKPSANKKVAKLDDGPVPREGQSSFTMCRLKLDFKILDEILVGHTRGINHLLMSRLNLHFKILGEILVSDTWGSIIFCYVQAESYL